jgi:hypothetical protein
MILDALVEGTLDEAVAVRLIDYCGHKFGAAYGKKGWRYLRENAGGFNIHARYGNPILMLVDFMDTKLNCPPEVPAIWLPNRCNKMLLRTVVREIESWLLADSQGMARFLGISATLISLSPESLYDPKQTLVNLARRSRKKAPREWIVPQPHVSSVVGPGYNTALEEFVSKYWNIDAALQRAPSLQRCVTRLGELHDNHCPPHHQLAL